MLENGNTSILLTLGLKAEVSIYDMKTKHKMKIPHEEVKLKEHTKYEEEPVIKGKSKYSEESIEENTEE